MSETPDDNSVDELKETDENGEAEEKPEKQNNKPKTPVKSPKKRKREASSEEDVKSEEEEEEEENDAGPKKPLFDQPLEITGSRERKKVERLAFSANLQAKDKKVEIQEGSGTKLGECPRIEHNLTKVKADELKVLHRILYNRVGASTEVKKNLRQFSGFTFKKSSPEFDKKKAALERLFLPDLKKMCEVLDVERKGTKESIVQRLLEFLMEPTDSGKKVPKSKSRSRSKEGSKKKSSKSKGKKTPAKKSKSKAKGSTDEDGSDEDEKEDESKSEDEKSDDDDKEEEKSDDEKSEDGKEDSDFSESEKKKKAAPKRKAPPPKKQPAKKKEPPKKKSKVSSDEHDSSSSDDEPLAKKKKSPPTNEDLTDLIKKILDGANLEEITMKTVCKQVYAAYPDFDLAEKKEFIKKTVHSLIS